MWVFKYLIRLVIPYGVKTRVNPFKTLCEGFVLCKRLHFLRGSTGRALFPFLGISEGSIVLFKLDPDSSGIASSSCLRLSVRLSFTLPAKTISLRARLSLSTLSSAVLAAVFSRSCITKILFVFG